MFRKSASSASGVSHSSRQKSVEDAATSGWMSMTMSLMDNEHHHTSEKRQSVSEHEADLTTNARSVYRLVDRESKFQQAKYPIYVQRILPLEEVFKLFYAKDPVLAMTNISTLKGFLVMLLFFIFSCALTAIPWYLMGQNEYYREDCSVETTGFQRAFIFSSQVIMTIGFGTKDIFFGECIIPTIVLTVHCGVSLLVQSIIMGIIYQRLSRATSRRHTVVFSNCAVIRRIRGKLFFMLQVSELRAMQLVETHVRLYVVRHESMPGGVDEDCCEEQFPSPAPAPALSAEGGGGAFTTSQPRYRQSKKQIQVNSEEDVLYTQTFAMRLSQPNDDLGGKILLSTPQIIVHEIDAHSPLRPPSKWTEEPRATAQLPPRGVAPRPSLAFGGILSVSDTDSNSYLSRPSVSVGSPLAATLGVSGNSGHISNINSNTNTNNTNTNVTDGEVNVMGSDIFHNNGVGVSDQRALHLNTGTHFPPNDYQFPEIIQNKGKSGGGAQPPAAAHPCTKGEEGADTDRMNDVEAEKEKTRLFDLEKEEIQRFLLDKNAEIIVVLEGVDPMTSHNVQSYHSYISDEIKWDHFFVRCCSVVNGWTTVDFTKFHFLKKVSPNEGSVKNAPSHN